jgi:exopolysaccharide biosynthesis polyprenyl glycosylphosphotransferase
VNLGSRATTASKAGSGEGWTRRLWRQGVLARILSFRRRALDASERRALLLTGDLIGINAALLTLIAISDTLELSTLRLANNVLWFALLTIIWLLVAPASDCYRLHVTARRLASVFSVVPIGLLVIGIYVLVPYISPPLIRSRLDIVLFAAMTQGYLIAWRLVYISLVARLQIRHRVLIVGTGSAALAVSRAVRENLETDYEIAGFVAAEGCRRSDDSIRAMEVETSDELVGLVDQLGVAELVIATTDSLGDVLAEGVIKVYERGRRVTSVAAFYENATGQVPVDHVGPNWFDALPVYAGGRFPYVMGKRAIDLVGGLVGLILAVVTFPVIALLVRLDSPGPVLYHQIRVGRRGQLFTVHKYRTMPVDLSREAQSIWTRKQERDVTKVGRFLRKARLDELPQFWNVLAGSMSLVGPRPYIPEEVADLEAKIPFFRTRLLAAPGLTGWAQVRHGYGTTLADEQAKLQYDIYYIKHQSLYLDLLIVLRTVQSVLRLSGR